MDPTLAIEIAKAGASLLPSLIGAVAAIVEAGKSPADAAEIVRKDIVSRIATYERERAEDEAALAAKHATPPNPFGEQG